MALGCADQGAGGALRGAASGDTPKSAAGAAGSGLPGAGSSAAGGSGDAGSLGGAASGGAPSGGVGSTAGAAQAGAAAVAGSTACSAQAMPEPEPAGAPTPTLGGIDAGAKTSLKSGNYDDAATNVLAVSSAAGVKSSTRNGAALWQTTESGAWLEYMVEAATPGSYAIVVMYYAAEAGGIVTTSVDGANVGVSRFTSRELAGEYGGVPNCCARGHGVLTTLGVGVHHVRVSVSPRSKPLEIYGLQINFAGQQLAHGGQVHAVSATAAVTTLPVDGVSDFYRMNYDAANQAWPCQKSFCRVEYLVSPDAPGRYRVALHYQKIDNQCMGLGLQLEDESKAVFRLEQDASVTAPVELELPCGVSRISLRDPNYVEGEFCSFGALFGSVELTPVR